MSTMTTMMRAGGRTRAGAGRERRWEEEENEVEDDDNNDGDDDDDGGPSSTPAPRRTPPPPRWANWRWIRHSTISAWSKPMPWWHSGEVRWRYRGVTTIIINITPCQAPSPARSMRQRASRWRSRRWWSRRWRWSGAGMTTDDGEASVAATMDDKEDKGDDNNDGEEDDEDADCTLTDVGLGGGRRHWGGRRRATMRGMYL